MIKTRNKKLVYRFDLPATISLVCDNFISCLKNMLIQLRPILSTQENASKTYHTKRYSLST